MQKSVSERLPEVMMKALERDDVEVDINANLSSLGLNSILFIKIVVALEDAFNIDFDDEDLNNSRFGSIQEIITYVELKMEAQ
jgi:acyl carrier protein